MSKLLTYGIIQQKRKLGWELPQTIHLIGDSIVNTEGTIVIAKNARSGAGSVTVNGVTFTNASTLASSGGGTAVNISTIYQLGNISSDFENMMDSFCYEVAAVDLLTLTIGKIYLLQLFISDDRNNTTYRNRTQYYTVGAYTSESTANYPAYSIIARFRATDTSMTTRPYGSGQIINGFQLRQLD